MKKTEVTINGDRILEVNGKPFFPIGARHLPKGADFPALRKAGFNCMRWPVFGMDAARLESMSLPPDDLGGLLFYPYIFDRGDFSKDEENRSRQLKELIDEVKDHPAMLCYEQRNEPAYHFGDFARPKSPPEGLIKGSAFIREHDPSHPIRIGHGNCNLVSTLQKYTEAVDIVGCNPYVVMAPGMRINQSTRFDGKAVDSPNQTLSAVGDFTDKMIKAAKGKAVWMQLQAMPNENWYSELFTPQLKGQGLFEYQKFCPNAWQMRFMAFNAIVRGATAMEWAMFGVSTEDSAWMDICKVIGELGALQDMLSSPAWKGDIPVAYAELGFSDWTGVETLVKLYEGRPWIIAVNTQFDPMEATFAGIPSSIGCSLEVFGENRGVEVSNGCFKDRFQPYEVHIYRPL